MDGGEEHGALPTPRTPPSAQLTIPHLGDGISAIAAEGNNEMVLDVIDGLPLEPAEEGQTQQKNGHLAPPVIVVCGN